jgi:hypothetical protein
LTLTVKQVIINLITNNKTKEMVKNFKKTEMKQKEPKLKAPAKWSTKTKNVVPVKKHVKTKKVTLVEYERNNRKVSIKGEGKHVRLPILMDLFSSRLIWLAGLIGLLVALPTTSLGPTLIKFFKGFF